MMLPVRMFDHTVGQLLLTSELLNDNDTSIAKTIAMFKIKIKYHVICDKTSKG